MKLLTPQVLGWTAGVIVALVVLKKVWGSALCRP